MRKITALLLALMMVLACIPAVAEDVAVKTGLSFVTDVKSSKDGAAQANIALTAVTVDDNGVITSCVIDYVQAKIKFDETGKLTTDKATEFQSKNELGDGYGMRKASSISAEWNEQAASFASYITGKTAEQVMGIAIDEATKPTEVDLSTSVTISIGGFQALIQKAAQ